MSHSKGTNITFYFINQADNKKSPLAVSQDKGKGKAIPPPPANSTGASGMMMISRGRKRTENLDYVSFASFVFLFITYKAAQSPASKSTKEVVPQVLPGK
jgi:hypothetical protein